MSIQLFKAEHKDNHLETTVNSNIKLRFQYSINHTVSNKAPML